MAKVIVFFGVFLLLLGFIWAADTSGENGTVSNSSAPPDDDSLNGAAAANPDNSSQDPSGSNVSLDDSPSRAAFTISFSAVPATGEAPLEVHFSASEAEEYKWDFTSDGVVDATSQNTSWVFSQSGEFNVRLTARRGTQEAHREEKVTVLSEVPNVSVTSYFPTSFALGEQDITIVLVNHGKTGLQALKGKIIGPGIQFLTSTSIDVLPSGEEDSLTITARFLQTGALNTTLKVAGKNIPLVLKVLSESQYNKEDLQGRLDDLKNQVQQQESFYYDKKADGYLVAEMYENIKLAKISLQEAQEDILTNKLDRAAVKLDLLNSSLTDIAADLKTAQKQKQTALAWLKENAVAVTAIIAALGTLGGIIIKATQHARKIGGKIGGKLSENVKKMKRKEDLPDDQNASDDVQQEDSTTSEEAPAERSEDDVSNEDDQDSSAEEDSRAEKD